MKKVTKRSINQLLKSQILNVQTDGDIHQFRILRIREGLRWDYTLCEYRPSNEFLQIDIECYSVNADRPSVVYTSSRYKSHQTNRWIRWGLGRKSHVVRSTISMLTGNNCQDFEIKSIKRSPIPLGKVNYSFI